MTGTTEKLFAGNFGSAKGATDRVVVTGTDWLDVEGEIMISFDLDSGTPDFPPVKIMEGETLGSKFPTTTPVREGYRFLGWYNEETEVTATTVLTVKTTLKAKWELTTVVNTWTVDLTGVTKKNTTAWTTNYSNGLVFAVGEGFSAGFYDTVEINCKFYGSDGTTEITPVENGNFQFKWHGVQVDNANGANIGTAYNFGANGVAAPEGGEGVIVTLTIPEAAKTGGLWGIGIQSSSAMADNVATFAQFVEVLSITFPAPAPAAAE
jgi:uncharacterized repeat protein (TIGR02543 family)